MLLLVLNNLVWASSGQNASPGGSFMVTMLPFLVIVLIFYFLLIRPQQKKEREHQETLKSLKKGDNVLTTGGIYGEIMEVFEDSLIVKVAPAEIKIKIARNAIAGLIKDKQKEEKKKGSKN